MSELIEVDFKPSAEPNELPLRVRSRQDNKCKHVVQSVDEELRTVHCRDCSELLDPVQVIVNWAKNWGQADSWLTRTRREVRLLESEVEELKRQKKNLASQVARLRGKVTQ